MERIVKTVLMLAAYGLTLALCEHAIPQSGVRKAARAAIGLLFIGTVAEQIAGILQ
jgi:hypothetical protein